MKKFLLIVNSNDFRVVKKKQRRIYEIRKELNASLPIACEVKEKKYY